MTADQKPMPRDTILGIFDDGLLCHPSVEDPWAEYGFDIEDVAKIRDALTAADLATAEVQGLEKVEYALRLGMRNLSMDGFDDEKALMKEALAILQKFRGRA